MPRTTQQLLNLTPGQMAALVGTNLGEAGHTAKDQQLVGLTVLGRTIVPGYGKTPTDVGWAPNQFVANAGISRAQAEDPNYWMKRYGAKQYQERLGLLNDPNALLGAVNSYGVPLSFRSGSSIPKSQRRATDIYGGDEKIAGNVFFDTNKNAANILRQRLSAGMPEQGTTLAPGATGQSTLNVKDALSAALGYQVDPTGQTLAGQTLAQKLLDEAKNNLLWQAISQQPDVNVAFPPQ